MERSGDEVPVSRARRARQQSRDRDDGVGLIEILVAFLVFMICFVPLLQLLPEGAQVIATSADQREATNVANSTLQSYQSTQTPPTFASTSNLAPTWGQAVRTATTEGGLEFEIYTLGGWCRSSISPGTGTVLASDQPSYHIVVKVGWGKYISADSTSHVVVDSTELASVTGAPATGAVVNECPLGLP